MTKDEALKLVGVVGPLPKYPVMHKNDQCFCPCGHWVYLICAGGMGFDPGYYVCPKCKRTVRIGEPPRTVHVLEAGRTFCSPPDCAPKLPKDWPKNHSWVRREDAQHATCPECLKAMHGQAKDKK